MTLLRPLGRLRPFIILLTYRKPVAELRMKAREAFGRSNNVSAALNELQKDLAFSGAKQAHRTAG